MHDVQYTHTHSAYLTKEQLEEYCRRPPTHEHGSNLGDGFNVGRITRPVFVRIDGRGFAAFDTSPAFRTGLTAAEITRWTSDSALAMRAPRGGDAQLPVTLTVSHQVRLLL
jgi:hypothetical protein